MPLRTRRQPEPTDPTDVDDVAAADRPAGPFIAPAGPTLDQLLDQDPANPWRVDPAAVPLLLPALTDDDALYRARRQWEQQQHAGQSYAQRAVLHAARTRLGLPLWDQWRQQDIEEWPPGIDHAAQGWIYAVFHDARDKAERRAREREQTRRTQAGIAYATRCVVCGGQGDTRRDLDPRRTVIDRQYPVFMHADCGRAVEHELNRRAWESRTPDGRPLAQVAAGWLDAD